MKIRCGYEDECKAKECFHCRRYLPLKTDKITLAEAVCIEDFGIVDLEIWMKTKPEEFRLAEKIMMKLSNKIIWDD